MRHTARFGERPAGGGLHVAPQVSPDGEWVVYMSERNFFFVDLYLADVRTGRRVQKLVGSALNANFESLRFINSAGSWAPGTSVTMTLVCSWGLRFDRAVSSASTL